MRSKSISRRDVLKYGMLSAVGVSAGGLILGCAQAAFTTATQTAADAETGSDGSGGTCSVIPSETAGPYPAHDDDAKNVLRYSGIVRTDITKSLTTAASAGYSGTATAVGVPLTMTLNLKNVSSSCGSLAGYAIYIWHCNVSGAYSMYSSGITTETYLRGVQVTDSSGSVTFKTILPGCYDGRMTHIHFEIYPSLAQAVDDNYAVKTSQLTFPMSALNAVYNNDSRYSTSKTNLARISYATDNVFGDGYANQIATIVSGDYSSGYVASMNVGIKA